MDVLNAIFANANGGEEGLPVLASSFRLFIELKAMAEGDSNDDLQDAWSERKAGLFNGLASTVGKFGMFSRHILASHNLTQNRCVDDIPPASGCHR